MFKTISQVTVMYMLLGAAYPTQASEPNLWKLSSENTYDPPYHADHKDLMRALKQKSASCSSLTAAPPEKNTLSRRASQSGTDLHCASPEQEIPPHDIHETLQLLTGRKNSGKYIDQWVAKQGSNPKPEN